MIFIVDLFIISCDIRDITNERLHMQHTIQEIYDTAQNAKVISGDELRDLSLKLDEIAITRKVTHNAPLLITALTDNREGNMTEIKPTHETDWLHYPYFGQVAYKIQLVNDRINPLQRHIWKNQAGEVETQDWIQSNYFADRLKDGFKEVQS